MHIHSLLDRSIFLLSFLCLSSLGFTLMLYFPMHESPDIQSYLGIAQGEWDQNIIRKYRIIIPLLAGGLNKILQPALAGFQPWSFQYPFSLCTSFLLINSMVMSLVAVLLYQMGRSFQLSHFACLGMLIYFFTNRWTQEITALPLVDSLYILAITLLLSGLVMKKEDWVIISIFIGPWSKEAFVFMLPMLLYCKEQTILRNRIICLLVSGTMVFGFRLWWDFQTHQALDASLQENISSVSTIPSSFVRLISFHGLYELFSLTGLWIILLAWAGWKHRQAFYSLVCSQGTWFFYTHFFLVLLQALLSGDLGRMFYLAIPWSALWIGCAIHSLIRPFLSEQYPAAN